MADLNEKNSNKEEKKGGEKNMNDDSERNIDKEEDLDKVLEDVKSLLEGYDSLDNATKVWTFQQLIMKALELPKEQQRGYLNLIFSTFDEDMKKVMASRKEEVKHKKHGKFNFRKTPSTPKKGAIAKEKTSKVKKVKEVVGKLLNFDKMAQLFFINTGAAILGGAVVIKDTAIKVAKPIKKAGSFVASIPNRIKERFNKFYTPKKQIAGLVKGGMKRLDAMKEVYGDKAEKHLDYRIVNRTVKIKEGVCQSVKTVGKGIAKVSSEVVDWIKKPFEFLRDNVRDNSNREELQNAVKAAREKLQQRQAALTRSKGNNSGYVAMGALVILSTIIVSAIAFIIVGSLLGR